MPRRPGGTFVILDHAVSDAARSAGGPEGLAIYLAYLRLCGDDNALGPYDGDDAKVRELAGVSPSTLRRRRRQLVAAGLLVVTRYRGLTNRVSIGDRTPVTLTAVASGTPVTLTGPPVRIDSTPGHADRGTQLERKKKEQKEGSLSGQIAFDELAAARSEPAERDEFDGYVEPILAGRWKDGRWVLYVDETAGAAGL